MSYKEEMFQSGDSFDGGAGYVPSEVFLAVRENDNFVIGIIDFRHPLSDFLKSFGFDVVFAAEIVVYR